jgi:hypothetical protein
MLTHQMFYIVTVLCVLMSAGALFNKHRSGKLVASGAFIALLFAFYYSIQPRYVEVKRINSQSYIGCIESIEYIMGPTTSVLVDNSGNPKNCKTVIYTYDQTKLPENESKEFKRVDLYLKYK